MFLFLRAAMTQDLTIRADHPTAHYISIIHTRAITRTRDTAVIIRTVIASIGGVITTIITRTEIEVTTGPTTLADEAFIMYMLLQCIWAR